MVGTWKLTLSWNYRPTAYRYGTIAALLLQRPLVSVRVAGAAAQDWAQSITKGVRAQANLSPGSNLAISCPLCPDVFWIVTHFINNYRAYRHLIYLPPVLKIFLPHHGRLKLCFLVAALIEPLHITAIIVNTSCLGCWF